MAELTLHQLEVDAQSAVSLVEHLTAALPRAQREAASDALIHELLVEWWKGIPGRPRGSAKSATPTDVNFLQVLATVMEHWPRTFSRLGFGGG